MLLLCFIYVCGFGIAYLGFMVDRRLALTAPVTGYDRRDALLATAIWPVLLLAAVVSPLWVAAERFLSRRNPGRRMHQAVHVPSSLSIHDLVQGTPVADQDARLVVVVPGVGKIRLVCRSGLSVVTRMEGATRPPGREMVYIGEVETTYRAPALPPPGTVEQRGAL